MLLSCPTCLRTADTAGVAGDATTVGEATACTGDLAGDASAVKEQTADTAGKGPDVVASAYENSSYPWRRWK